jgi:hypothetical protein
MSVLDKVRQWMDGDSTERVLEQAARDAQVKPRSKAEEFIVKIAREVESVMQAEMVPFPQGTTMIPTEYTIFLSEQDDKEWRGVKRKGLEQGLYHILSERAREIAGSKKLGTKSFILELRIDGTLEKGDIRVQHSWEDSAKDPTGVLPRITPPDANDSTTRKTSTTNPNLKVKTDVSKDVKPVIPAPVFPEPDIRRAEPLLAEETEDLTRVKPRASELYRLEVYRNNVRQTVVPIYDREIVIGRGSKTKPVNIPLTGDVEISRRHLTLMTDEMGNFWALNEGKNAAEVNDQELPSGQRVPVRPGMPINICSYMLRIQP